MFCAPVIESNRNIGGTLISQITKKKHILTSSFYNGSLCKHVIHLYYSLLFELSVQIGFNYGDFGCK